MIIPLKNQKENLIVWVTEGKFTASSSLSYESQGINREGIDPKTWNRTFGKTWLMLRMLNI